MNMFITYRSLMASALVGASLALSQGAAAATAQATASITDITLINLTISNHQYLSDAAVGSSARDITDSGFDVGSVLTPWSFNMTAGSNAAFAQIDDSFAPLPQTTASAAGQGFGTASVLWTFDWHATSTGTASVNLETLFGVTILNRLAGESALASSHINAFVDGTAIGQDLSHLFNNVNGDDSGFEHLLLNFSVTAGQEGTITVTAGSDALTSPVPVPAALWLLAPALGFLRTRRNG